MREPYWGDYVLIAVTMQIASSLFAIATVLWSVRVRAGIQEAKRTLLGFIVFLYSLWCVLGLNVLARVLFVSAVTSSLLKQMVMAQIVVATMTALISLWVLYLVLRPKFHHDVRDTINDAASPAANDDHAEPPGQG